MRILIVIRLYKPPVSLKSLPTIQVVADPQTMSNTSFRADAQLFQKYSSPRIKSDPLVSIQGISSRKITFFPGRLLFGQCLTQCIKCFIPIGDRNRWIKAGKITLQCINKIGELLFFIAFEQACTVKCKLVLKVVFNQVSLAYPPPAVQGYKVRLPVFHGTAQPLTFYVSANDHAYQL